MKATNLKLTSAIALGVLLTIGPIARAQTSKDDTTAPPPTTQRTRRATQTPFQRFATQLKLNDEQKTKIQPLYTEEMKKLREIRQDTGISAVERRDRIRTTRADYTAKIKAHLTPEQVELYDKMQQRGSRTTRNPGQNGTQPAPGNNSNSNPSNSK